MGEGGIVEGSLSLVVLCTDGHFTLKESSYYHILAIVTGHVEGSTAMTVDSIRLRGEGMERGRGAIMSPIRRLGSYQHIHYTHAQCLYMYIHLFSCVYHGV